MKPTILSIAFTVIYTFAFREATKSAAEWGAFQIFGSNTWFKVSAWFPWFLTLLFYWWSLRVIPRLDANSLGDLVWRICQITLLGFLPFAAAHVWNLVAQYKVAKGTQPGENWLIVKPSDLPHVTYSLEVLALGIVQVVLLFYLSQPVSLDFRAVGAALSEDLPQLFVIFYVSEMIVLHHRAKSLHYFYPEDNPKHLLACRTIPSWFVAVLLPIMFAIFCSPWVLWLQKTNELYVIFGLVLSVLSVLGLVFPVCCNNGLLVVAEKHEWIDKSSPELQGPKWFWKPGLVSVAVLVLITWTKWDTYYEYGRDILILTEENVLPERAREPLPRINP